ncbi:hypothetical protein SKAU_G00327630 [Synaphobranchus kaupii]|uniref:Uncharacterized protein n=1 Tax=Synaphobranchus kaupii TaxID=118154 RepID=A0A9Q1EQ15_SYNKA|nr:hypothetical protein SKAU_G00327630 [Synaphobranchus kaupii]
MTPRRCQGPSPTRGKVSAFGTIRLSLSALTLCASDAYSQISPALGCDENKTSPPSLLLPLSGTPSWKAAASHSSCPAASGKRREKKLGCPSPGTTVAPEQGRPVRDVTVRNPKPSPATTVHPPH